MSRAGGALHRLYRRLLRLYPAEFRSEFGTEMERQFADEYREVQGDARRRFVLRTLADVLATAPVELARELEQDLRHALRLYAKSPWGTAIAVAVLSIGTAFVFVCLSLYVDLLLRPHPGFEDSARIATIGQTGGTRLFGLPFTITERMTDEMISVEAVAASMASSVLIGTDREAGGVELVSRRFFDGLRPRLALGRGFSDQEHTPDAEPVAVISYRLWHSRFGGRSDVLGALLEVTRDPREIYTVATPFDFGGRSGFMTGPGEPEQQTTHFRIVGVLADSLRGLAQPDTALWVPLERAHLLYVGSDRLLAMSAPRTYVRKRAGISTLAVLDEVDARYGDEPILADSLHTLDAIDGVFRDIDVQRSSNRQLNMFLAGSILLALAAAANVSLFLLARAPGRRRELGIRMAIGAPVRRLARQLVSEASLLVLSAAVIGIVGSAWLSTLLRGLALFRDAEWRHVTLLDWRVLTLGGLFLLLLCLLVSLAPVVGLERRGIEASSRRSTSRASFAQRLAGTAQCGAAGALGAAAIAFVWHLGTLTYGDPGFELNDRYVAHFGVPQHGRASDRGLVAIVRLREIIAAIPGVSAVAFGSAVPAEEEGRFVWQIADPADPTKELDIRWTMIDSRYIETLGLTLIHGRAPEDSEDDVVLLNQTLARAWWGRDDVVGEPLPFSVPYVNPTGTKVIGVLEDLSFGHPAATVMPRAFMASTYLSESYGAAVIETSMTAAALRQELDRIIANGDLEIPINEVLPLEKLRHDALAADRARGTLTIATAALVVLLSALGFYGTQRYLVVAGQREYAIRASLGAGPNALGRLVMRRGLYLGIPGLVLGGVLSFVFVAWLRDGLVTRDVSAGAVTIGVVAGLALLLLAASLAPARTARRTQPAALLRE